MKKSLLLVSALFFLFNSFSQNQVKGNFKRFSLDIYGGLPMAHGDIKNKMAGYEVTGRLNWNWTRAFAVGTEYSMGYVKGENKNNTQEYFSNKYMKAMAGFELFLFDLAKFNELTSWFQPYAGYDLGAIKSDIESSGNTIATNDKHFNNWVFAQQIHAGLKFKIAKSLDLNARYNLAFLKTDIFDNYKPATNNRSNDMLSSITLGLTLHMGGKGKPVTYWTGTELNKDELNNKADKATQDSLAAQINALNESLKNTASDLAELSNQNAEQQTEIDSLTNAYVNSKNTVNNTSNSGEEYGYSDIPLLETGLNGDVNATYYIIAGSYMVPVNAEKRVEELKSKGLNPFIMVEPSTSLHRVAIDYSDNAKDAFTKATKYRSEVDPNAWVIKNTNK